MWLRMVLCSRCTSGLTTVSTDLGWLVLLPQVLEDLLAENDSVPDVWHLLGLSYYSGGMLTEAAEICQAGMQLVQKQHIGPEDDITISFLDLQSAIQEAQAAETTAQQ